VISTDRPAPRSANSIVATDSALVARSEHPSPTPQSSKLWNWHRPERRQSWLLRSPGILSACPVRISPAQAASSWTSHPPRMRNPSHQLIVIAEQMTCHTVGKRPAPTFAAVSRCKIAGNRTEMREDVSKRRWVGFKNRGELRSILRNHRRLSLRRWSRLPFTRQSCTVSNPRPRSDVARTSRCRF